jgi:hypothetical protein
VNPNLRPKQNHPGPPQPTHFPRNQKIIEKKTKKTTFLWASLAKQGGSGNREQCRTRIHRKKKGNKRKTFGELQPRAPKTKPPVKQNGNRNKMTLGDQAVATAKNSSPKLYIQVQ